MSAYNKAILGFFAPALVLLVAAFTDGSLNGSDLTGRELTTALITALVTAAGVYGVRNGATHDRGTSTPDL